MKKSKSHSKRSLSRARGLLNHPTTNHRLGRAERPLLSFETADLREIEDRRVFRHLSSPSSLRGTKYKLKPKNNSLHHVGFDIPSEIMVCVRRKQRKEVLFATGGSAKRHKRKPKRNFWSNVRC